jgi:transposase
LLSDCLDDYVSEDHPVRVVDAFIDELDLAVVPEATGHSSYHPATPLKIYLYGYLN